MTWRATRDSFSLGSSAMDDTYDQNKKKHSNGDENPLDEFISRFNTDKQRIKKLKESQQKLSRLKCKKKKRMNEKKEQNNQEM